MGGRSRCRRLDHAGKVRHRSACDAALVGRRTVEPPQSKHILSSAVSQLQPQERLGSIDVTEHHRELERYSEQVGRSARGRSCKNLQGRRSVNVARGVVLYLRNATAELTADEPQDRVEPPLAR